MIQVKEPFSIYPLSDIIEALTELRDEANKQEKWDYGGALTVALAWLEACKEGQMSKGPDPAPSLVEEK